MTRSCHVSMIVILLVGHQLGISGLHMESNMDLNSSVGVSRDQRRELCQFS